MQRNIYEEFEEYHDDDIYTEDEISLLLEDDEISSAEAAFMHGYIEEE